MAVAQRRIPLSEPTFDGNEARYLQQCIEEGWVASRGRFVHEFEALFARRHGRDDAVTTSSGTTALHLALEDLGVGRGDEVIVPAMTFIATVNPVRYVGATPIFVDVDPQTYGLDVDLVAEAVTPRTKAVIPVHLFGHPIDADALLALTEPRGIAVIEDAAEALGSACRGRMCGTLGDVAAFSFNGNKVITSGGGGMLLAADAERLRHLRHLTLQARVPGSIEYLHDEVGHNAVLSNLQAAVGLAQLERLDDRLAARRAIATRYAAALAVPDLGFCTEAPWAQHNWWLMSVLVDESVGGRTKDTVMTALRAAGIDSRPFFRPLPDLPPYREFAGHDHFPVARRLHAQGVSIPSSSHLTHDDQELVCAVLRGE